MSRDCICYECVSACKRKPGIFKPGEAEKAAEHLGLSFDEFKKNLLLDWYDEDLEEKIWYWSPKVTSDSPTRKTADYGWAFDPGQCVFLKDDRCSIHAVKPFECRKVFVCSNPTIRGKMTAIQAWIAAGNPLKDEAENADG